MKLLFNPDITGFAYTNLKGVPGHTLFDCQVISLAGLLDLLQMYSGVNVKVAEPFDRLLKYYKLLKSYVDTHESCILANSFKVDGLNTAKQCLSWRDALRYAGWNEKTVAPSSRLEALSAVEKDFDLTGTADLLLAITDGVKSGTAIPQNLEIQIPCAVDLMMPAVGNFLKVLENRGVKVYEMPRPADGDLKIEEWKFGSEEEALSYLTSLDANAFDVWINSDNKLMDSWLKAQGKPTTGSIVMGTNPEIAQLFVMWVGLFIRPLNIKNLYAWLSSKFCPLSWELSRELKDKISFEGGFYNKECSDILAKYKAAEYQGYLPSDGENLDIEGIRKYADKFIGYCKRRAGMLENKLTDAEKKALYAVAEQVASLKTLLDGMNYVDLRKEFNGWVRTICSTLDYPQYAAQVGCSTVIGNPGNLMDNVQSCIWCDFYNDPGTTFTYEFLTVTERCALEPYIFLWKGEKETEYRNSILMLPLLHTSKKLVLVNVDRVGSERAVKHPLLIQLEADKRVGNPICPILNLVDKSAIPMVDNREEAGCEEILFKHKAKVPMRKSESASSLESLVKYPLDYLLEQSLHLKRVGAEAMSPFVAARGTVAHEVIQKLLTMPSYTEDDLNRIFDTKVRERGAILLLDENIGELSNIKLKTGRFVDWLKKIMVQNHLTFVESEKAMELSNVFGNIGMEGRLDLVLKDDSNGYHIFDIKYSKSEYESYVKKNEAVQLAVYKELMIRNGFDVKGIAYVIVDARSLLSTYKYEGERIKVIKPKNDSELFPKIEARYRERAMKFSEGCVEITEKKYSNYNLFKGTKA